MPDFLKVEDVLNNLILREDMVAAEFGCGAADFTIAVAKKMPKGKVYALDIQEEKLSALKGKLVLANINNVSTILCDLEMPKGSTLPENSIDIVLIPNVLFQAENKYAIIEEGKRILKNGGQLLVIDWLPTTKKEVPFAPKDIVSPEEMKIMAAKLNLTFKKQFAAGDYHYGLLFIK